MPLKVKYCVTTASHPILSIAVFFNIKIKYTEQKTVLFSAALGVLNDFKLTPPFLPMIVDQIND